MGPVPIEGDVKNILTGERTALNFLSHISGVATITNQFVKKVKNSKYEKYKISKPINNHSNNFYINTWV